MSTILIAYERETEQSTLDQLLTQRGHRVVKSSSGLEALETARREPPHLMLADVLLPRMDGFALYRRWKQDERLQHVPFILYSPRHSDPKYERFAMELGVSRFLARLTQPDVLLRTVDDVLTEVGAKQAADQRVRELQEAHARELALAKREVEEHTRILERVSELENLNGRLAAGTERFRTLFEANPLPLLVIDRETNRFVAANIAAANLYGYERAELLTLNGLQELSGSSAEPTPEVDGAASEWHQRKDGSRFAAQARVANITFDGREASLCAVLDVSERVRDQAALAAAARARRDAMGAFPDGYCVLDREGKLLDSNDAFCALAGRPREALLKLSMKDLESVDPGATTRLHTASSANQRRYHTRLRRPDGTHVDVEIATNAVESDAGQIVSVRDISTQIAQLRAARAREKRLETLLDLVQSAEDLDESAVIARLLNYAAAVLASPSSFLYAIDAQRRTVTLLGCFEAGRGTTLSTSAPQPLQQTIWADALRSSEPLVFNGTEPQSADGLPELKRHLTVVADDGTVLLGVANRNQEYVSEEGRELTRLSRTLSRLLRDKRARTQTVAALQRADVTVQATIDMLCQLTERHDPYTAGSAKRVADLAVAIARDLGLDGERQHTLRVAALLHDIGNITVPAELLARPAMLSDAERALVHTHAAEGARLLEKMALQGPVAEIVHQHHERMDGSGYPRALKGAEILLEARILVVADVMEALCGHRPHRLPFDIDAALADLNQNAKSLYDADAVSACTRLFRQHGFAFAAD